MVGKKIMLTSPRSFTIPYIRGEQCKMDSIKNHLQGPPTITPQILYLRISVVVLLQTQARQQNDSIT